MLDIVLMCDEQVTVRAVPTCFIEREQGLWFDVDDQRELSLVHLIVTLGTLRTAHIPIRVEKEAVAWRLFPELGDRCLFLFGHSWMISPLDDFSLRKATNLLSLFFLHRRCRLLLTTIIKSCQEVKQMTVLPCAARVLSRPHFPLRPLLDPGALVFGYVVRERLRDSAFLSSITVVERP
jgi:hypothetical protein